MDMQIEPIYVWHNGFLNNVVMPSAGYAPEAGYISDAETWARFWEAWRPYLHAGVAGASGDHLADEVPAIDFTRHLAIVQGIHGKLADWKVILTETGDLRLDQCVLEINVRGLIIAVVDRLGAKTFHGQALWPANQGRLDLAWRTATVLRLAQAATEERHLIEGNLDPTRLAVLADGLEEAGCSCDKILGHLRGSGPHTPGCWAVDLILLN